MEQNDAVTVVMEEIASESMAAIEVRLWKECRQDLCYELSVGRLSKRWHVDRIGYGEALAHYKQKSEENVRAEKCLQQDG